jgi:hypothetical protein
MVADVDEEAKEEAEVGAMAGSATSSTKTSLVCPPPALLLRLPRHKIAPRDSAPATISARSAIPWPEYRDRYLLRRTLRV